jgi:hypothetical protein
MVGSGTEEFVLHVIQRGLHPLADFGVHPFQVIHIHDGVPSLRLRIG